MIRNIIYKSLIGEGNLDLVVQIEGSMKVICKEKDPSEENMLEAGVEAQVNRGVTKRGTDQGLLPRLHHFQT